MAGVNKVILVGNLGKDPEIRHLEGGAAVANFTLATSESYKDKSGVRQESTEWHNVVVWRGLAEIAEKYLKKGMTIYVEGKLRTNITLLTPAMMCNFFLNKYKECSNKFKV